MEILRCILATARTVPQARRLEQHASAPSSDLQVPSDATDAALGNEFDADLLRKRQLSVQEQDEIPTHLLNDGLVLASTGSGGSGSGGAMYWTQTYLVYDKSSMQVWTINYRGNDFAGGSVSTAGPTAVATHMLNDTEAKLNRVTAAGRHILPGV